VALGALLAWVASLPRFLVGADSLRVGTGSMVGDCRSHATARRAAIDAVAASWTIAGRGRRLCAVPVQRDAWSRLNHRALRVWPGVRRAASPRRSPALTPGQRRRRRRLDQYYGLYRQRGAWYSLAVYTAPEAVGRECYYLAR